MSYIQLLSDFPLLMLTLHHSVIIQYLAVSPFLLQQVRGHYHSVTVVLFSLKVTICLEHNYLLGVWLTHPCWYE